ncbi:VanZ family protein [Actinoplanes sp. OR16]|uniref:VanZ family protein n=1 Tax=Actinoplanes sp. OR16 TaxID=946334 RepID=UPI00135F1990|nr:VanZ family protein [Actinoplanes sp. OR16]
MQTEIPALPVLLPLAAVLFVVTWWRLRTDLGRLLIGWLSAAYGLAVLAVTMLPLQIATGDHANRTAWYEKGNWLPVLTIDVVTFVANIVMFLPLGALLAVTDRTRTARQIALTALACSAAIEVVQFLTNVLVSSGRQADVNDLIANTIGGVLGFLAWRAISVRLVSAT